MNSIHVLLIVDADAAATQETIQRTHIPVKNIELAHSLDEAERCLREKNYDLLLLDIELPPYRGLSVLSHIRSLHEGILLVLTSLDDEKTAIEAIRRGADDYLLKQEINEKSLRRAIGHAQVRHGIRQVSRRFDERMATFCRLCEGLPVG